MAYVGDRYEVQVSTGVTTSYYAFGSQQVAMRRGNAVYWLHGDHLGSTSLTTSITGTKVSELRYYPWGGTRWVTGTMATDKRFTGQRLESGIGGLYDYGARFHSPVHGRFISADTIVPEPGDPRASTATAMSTIAPSILLIPRDIAEPRRVGNPCVTAHQARYRHLPWLPSLFSLDKRT